MLQKTLACNYCVLLFPQNFISQRIQSNVRATGKSSGQKVSPVHMYGGGIWWGKN